MDLERFTRLDWYSMAAVPIEMYFDAQPLATGTAFFWEAEDQVYLVTAWHCLSGRHAETKKHLNEETAAEPNRLKVWWNLDGQPVGRKAAHFLPIRNDDAEPLWLVDPENGSDIDVAMMPVTPPPGTLAYPINKLPQEFLGMAVGQDLFVLGFPLGVQGVGLPIWKRGSLASEWQIPDRVQPYYLVDTASRAGMSGSPVIKRVYDRESMVGRANEYGHNGKSSFLGIYSGRLAPGKNKEDLQLGVVWSEIYLHRIPKGGRLDGQAPAPWPPAATASAGSSGSA